MRGQSSTSPPARHLARRFQRARDAAIVPDGSGLEQARAGSRAQGVVCARERGRACAARGSDEVRPRHTRGAPRRNAGRGRAPTRSRARTRVVRVRLSLDARLAAFREPQGGRVRHARGVREGQCGESLPPPPSLSPLSRDVRFFHQRTCGALGLQRRLELALLLLRQEARHVLSAVVLPRHARREGGGGRDGRERDALALLFYGTIDPARLCGSVGGGGMDAGVCSCYCEVGVLLSLLRVVFLVRVLCATLRRRARRLFSALRRRQRATPTPQRTLSISTPLPRPRRPS